MPYNLESVVPAPAPGVQGRVLPASQYDLDTYFGRVQHFSTVTSPLRLLATDEEVEQSRDLLVKFKSGASLDTIKWSEVFKAKATVDSTLHPDTGEKILLPFRMACFVPTNLLVTLGLLWPNPSLGTLALWQWINQSVNVGFNWANANKSNPLSTQETLGAYTVAVGTSLGVAATLRKVSQRTGRGGMFIPFASVAVAGYANIAAMRYKEMIEGIEIYDEAGNIMGQSCTAGVKAVSHTALSRLLAIMPALVACPLAMAALSRRSRTLKNSMPLQIGVNALLISASTLVGLPLCIAIFPQRASIAPEELEAKFHQLRRADGSRIAQVYYNKGL